MRAERWIATETVAQFAPLLCGGLPHDKERALLRLLEGPRFCGHPDLRYALIPSTSPVSRDFRPARVLARAGVAGDDVAVLLVLRAPRLGRTRR